MKTEQVYGRHLARVSWEFLLDLVSSNISINYWEVQLNCMEMEFTDNIKQRVICSSWIYTDRTGAVMDLIRKYKNILKSFSYVLSPQGNLCPLKQIPISWVSQMLYWRHSAQVIWPRSRTELMLKILHSLWKGHRVLFLILRLLGTYGNFTAQCCRSPFILLETKFCRTNFTSYFEVFKRNQFSSGFFCWLWIFGGPAF